MQANNDSLSLDLLNGLLRVAQRSRLSLELLSVPSGQGLGWVAALVRVNGSSLQLVYHADGRYEVPVESTPRHAPAIALAVNALLEALTAKA